MRTFAAMRRLAAVLLVSSGLVAPLVSTSSASAGALPLTWGAPHRVAPYHDSPESLSCLSRRFCVAVDSAGNAMVERHATWSPPKRVAGRTLHDVSCGGTSMCLATGDDKVYRYDGTSWQRLSYPDEKSDFIQFESVSCPTATFCMLAGNNISDGVVLRYDGRRLSRARVVDGRPLATISCLRAGFCMAGDDRGRALTRVAGRWSTPLLVLHHHEGSPQEVQSLSCGSRTFCVAGAVTAAVWDGSSWTVDQVVDSTPGAWLSAVSCLRGRICAGSVDGTERKFADGQWGPAVVPTGADATTSTVLGLSCTDASTCQAIDLGGVAYAGTVNSLSEIEWVDRETHLTAIDCVTGPMCMAVDDTGHYLRYNGHRWSARRFIDGAPLTSVSCAGAQWCVAGDGAARVLTWNGSSWSRPSKVGVDFDQLRLSCPSTTFCAAIGNTTVMLDHNGVWSQPVTISPDHALNAISCSSASFCMATDDGGYVHRYQHGRWAAPLAVDLSHGDFEGLVAVSCTSHTFCAAVDDRRDDQGSGFTWNGASWSSRHVLGDSSLDSVDCTSSKFCVAVGWNGAGYYRQGTSWTHGYTVELGAPGMNGILAVSCADRSFCAYVDGNSAVGIGRA